jgi:hypothetical protein
MLKRQPKLRPHRSRLRLRDDEDDLPLKPPPPKRGLGGKLLYGEDITFAGQRFDGRYVVIGLILTVTIIGLGLWWAQNRAFYTEYTADTVVIAGNTYNVTRFRGIDAESSPLKLRACFLIEGTILAPQVEKPVPLVAPRWFKCFKAEYIERELAEGWAIAYLAEYDTPPGFDTVVAVSPGGRAYMWRQANANLEN